MCNLLMAKAERRWTALQVTSHKTERTTDLATTIPAVWSPGRQSQLGSCGKLPVVFPFFLNGISVGQVSPR